MNNVGLLGGATLIVESPLRTTGPDPSLMDISIGLGRQARFAGQTNHWWSVLHHLYAGYVALRTAGVRLQSPTMRLWLMHDAHEAFTSDIPSALKNEGVRQHQAEIDDWLWKHFGLPKQSGAAWEKVKDMDLRALRAEAYALRPPESPEMFMFRFGGPPLESDVKIVRATQYVHGSSASSAEGWNSPLVRWWVGRMRGLLYLPGGWNEDDGEDLWMISRITDKLDNTAYGDLYEEDD